MPDPSTNAVNPFLTRRRRFMVLGAIVVLVIASWMLIPALFARPHQATLESAVGQKGGLSASNSPVSQASDNPRTGAGLSGPGVTLIVHLVGEVTHPGLIVVPLGSRVIDAVLKAGGLTANANECAINLAREIRDGEQIIIPRHIDGVADCQASGTSTGSSGTPAGSPISLSRANAAELDTLPGVGPALAQRIIDYREAHGGFTSVKDLDNVSGIGPSLLASLTPLVTP